jgi:putative aldouronate transport system substrate-binding protein
MRRTGVLLLALLSFALAPLFGAGGSQSSGGGAASLGTGSISYPIKTDVTLTYWRGFSSEIAMHYTDQGQTPFSQELVKKTGVKIEFLHPPAGGDTEQLNLMFASNEMPDMIDWNWLGYPGGPEKAISDNIIYKLNDVYANYAPNLTKLLKDHPDWDKLTKTDNGSYYVFPFIRGEEKLALWQGLQIRKDWLDELGLQAPETFDEWYTVLKAFKERKNSPAPLALNLTNNAFAYGYNIDPGFYIGDDGRVKYGTIDPVYRTYLAMMAQWYKEGLLDPDAATLAGDIIVARMTSGASGATWGSLGGNMGTWTNAARATNPKFELNAVRLPSIRKGDKPQIVIIDPAYSGANSVAITTSCKSPEIAARWLDYGYSQEGYMYYNFGQEGVAYNMVNGYPTYTPLILKNPQGWSISQALNGYVRSVHGGPFVQAGEYFDQYMALPEQRNGPLVWNIAEPYKHYLPNITPTPEESRDFARIMGEINTYRTEWITKFMLGTEALTDASWNTFVSTIRRMGIDQALAIENAALDRFNKR